MVQVVSKLVKTVEDFLIKIGRYDYVDGYYEWEVHLTRNNQVNACCFPGGKIIVYEGLFSMANTEERLAFVLAHEMAHALLDHGRTKISAQNTKNGIAGVAMIRSLAFDLLGLGEIGVMTRAATNIIDLSSHFFLMQPWGRDQEVEADKLGMFIIHLAGYDVLEVPRFWREHVGENAGNFDFFSTHPADEKRISEMIQSANEILNTNDFYSQPLLSITQHSSIEQNNINPNISIETQNHSLTRNESHLIPSTTNNDEVRVCPSCGEITLNKNYCMNCGSKLEDEFNDNNLRCHRCGAIINKDDIFCTNCGVKLKIDFYCESCGNKVNRDDKFCTECGKKL